MMLSAVEVEVFLTRTKIKENFNLFLSSIKRDVEVRNRKTFIGQWVRITTFIQGNDFYKNTIYFSSRK